MNDHIFILLHSRFFIFLYIIYHTLLNFMSLCYIYVFSIEILHRENLNFMTTRMPDDVRISDDIFYFSGPDKMGPARLSFSLRARGTVRSLDLGVQQLEV